MSDKIWDRETLYKFSQISFSEDLTESYFIRPDYDTQNIMICVHCSDMFFWGTADAEELTPEDLPDLQKAIQDVKTAGEFGFYGVDLWTARKRNLLPQNAWLNTLPRDLAQIYIQEFEAREPDFGNPHALSVNKPEETASSETS